MSSAEPESLEGALPQSLIINNQRLITTRWMAGGGIILATLFSVHIVGATLPQISLLILGFGVLGYNAVLNRLTQKAVHPEPEKHVENIRELVFWQVILDTASMAFFVHLTGGITSPALVFFFLHVIMVTILLPGKAPYIYGFGVFSVVSLIALLEVQGILPHYHVIPEMPRDIYESGYYIAAQLSFFTVALISIAFVSISVTRPLRERERQIAALFQITHLVSSSLEMDRVLCNLAESAATTLDARGAAIYMQSLDGQKLKQVASNGQTAMEDETTIELRKPENERYQQALKQIVQDEESSELLVPIIGQRPLGVMVLYRKRPHPLQAPVFGFIRAIAHEGAIAIENAYSHEALQEAEKQRTQFVHVLTHELRSPVTSSQSLLRVMLKNMIGELSEKQRDIIQRISKRMDALHTLINDLLSLAESKAREFQKPLEPIQIQSIIDETLSYFQQEAADKNLQLEGHCEDQPLRIMATEEGLTRILRNLVGNAVKYTPNEGQVDIQLEKQNGHAIIRVMDTGIGIPEEALANIGEEFFRAPNARGSEIAGTGLGMATVQQLVNTFSGTMDIKSKVNEGTTFILDFPILSTE